MTTDERHLRIAALASGDLPDDDASALRSELAGDQQGRRLLRRLEADRQALRSLPRRRPRRDLAPFVLERLGQESPIVTLPERYRRPAHSMNVWRIILGLAACGLIAVMAIPSRNRDDVPKTVAQKALIESRTPAKGQGGDPALPLPPEVVVVPESVTPNEDVPPTPKSPAKPNGDVLTSAVAPKVSPIEVQPPRLSLPMALRDLGRAESLERLAAEFARARDHRLELFGNDTVRGIDEILRGLRSKGVATTFEPMAGEASRRKLRSPYCLLVDGLNQADWLAILKGLPQGDDASTLENLVLTGIADSDRRELKSLFGVDPLTKSTPSAAADPRRPLSDRTADEVAASISKGKPAKPEAYVAIFPPRGGALPAEAAQFLERRGPANGKLRIYLIVRAN